MQCKILCIFTAEETAFPEAALVASLSELPHIRELSVLWFRF